MMADRWIDLNADLGEGTGNDAAMMHYVSSANIACGGHAGDDDTIQQSIDLALKNEVTIGAHPGFEDKENFGRKQLHLTSAELSNQILRQLERFEGWAQKANTTTKYVKLHGALANMTAADFDLALTAYKAIQSFRIDMPILALANSQQTAAAKQLSLPVFDEAFADRAYTDDGQLASRAIEGAVLTQDKAVLEHVTYLLTTGSVNTISGGELKLPTQSICLHGDNAHAVQLAKRISETIKALGINIKSFANYETLGCKMTAKIIDGKAFAQGLRERIADHVERLKSEHNITPGLAVIIVGHDPASQVYVNNKAKQTKEVGMNSFKYELAADVPEAEVLSLIEELNNRDDVHGILCQLPVPKHIDENKIINALSPAKDVDCFSPENVGKVAIGLPGPVPCTPLGSLMLLRDELGDLTGLNAVVIGRSNLVGKPMGALLLRDSATVTIAHSRTKDLPAICAQADIVVAAVGRPEMVKGDWIKPGATVIDVGINRIAAPERGEGKFRLVGDVDYKAAAEVAGAITPVPGGVGPMTIACLLANTVTTACLANGLTPPSDLTA